MVQQTDPTPNIGTTSDHDLQQGKVIRQRPSAQSVGVDPMPSNELSGFAGKHFGLMLVVGSSSFVEQLANPARRALDQILIVPT